MATRKLAYFDAWFTLYERVNGGQPIPELRTLVEPELQAAQQLAQHGWLDAQRAPRWTLRGIKNYVLLTNFKGTFGMRVLKFFYWISLLYLLIIAPILISLIFSPPPSDTGQPPDVGSWIFGGLIAFFILGMAPVLILRALTKWRSRVAVRRGASPIAAAARVVDPEPGGSTPPAGWYSDPQSPALRRYWDGSGWTEHSAP